MEQEVNVFHRDIGRYLNGVEAGDGDADPLATLEKLYLYSKLVDRIAIVSMRIPIKPPLLARIALVTDAFIRRHVH